MCVKLHGQYTVRVNEVVSQQKVAYALLTGTKINNNG